MAKISDNAEINKIRLKEQGSAPATPASGYGYLYEKDDGKLYWKNDAGTEYDLTATGGGGGGGTVIIDKLYDDELSGSGTGWDVSSIDQTYDHLHVLVHGASPTAGETHNTYAYLNNDLTDSNYRHDFVYGGAAGSGGLGGAAPYIGALPGTNATESAAIFDLWIYNYTKTGLGYRMAMVNNGSYQGTTFGYRRDGWFIRLSTAAVNRIQIYCASNFKAGSRMQIFGMK